MRKLLFRTHELPWYWWLTNRCKYGAHVFESFRELDQPSFMDEDNEDIESGFSEILNALKIYLLKYYVPVQDPKDAEFHYSTQELHQQLLKLYPNELILTASLVADWMHVGGFTFFDYGEMKLEWIMKKA